MIEGMMKCGMQYPDAEANIKSRRTAYTKALSKYERERKKELALARPSRRQNKKNPEYK